MSAQLTPTREANPFATCWTRPGAIPFHFPDGNSPESLLARLRAQNWWGAILGPHGSGKTTLIESLKPALRACVPHVQAVALAPRAPRHVEFDSQLENGGLLIVDGYEQLGWMARLRLRRRCRQLGCGLLITAHHRTAIPTLLTIRPTQRLVELLVAGLTRGTSTAILPADVAASHARHGSNVRKIFFELYDQHERRRRRLL